jgi:hypothetical protein
MLKFIIHILVAVKDACDLFIKLKDWFIAEVG